MAKELESLDVTDSPELLQLAQEVAQTGVGRVLRTADGELAVLKPVPKSRRSSRGAGRPLTRDDALFSLVGIGSSGAPSDASERKHDILAKAYRLHVTGDRGTWL
jgi:hypothetical protein